MSRRMPKVNELLRQELSQLIHQEVGNEAGMLTVTDVVTTSDLQLAKVYVSVLNGDPLKAKDLLTTRARDFQRVIGRRLTMKFTPKLIFIINDEERRERVEQILENL